MSKYNLSTQQITLGPREEKLCIAGEKTLSAISEYIDNYLHGPTPQTHSQTQTEPQTYAEKNKAGPLTATASVPNPRTASEDFNFFVQFTETSEQRKSREEEELATFTSNAKPADFPMSFDVWAI